MPPFPPKARIDGQRPANRDTYIYVWLLIVAVLPKVSRPSARAICLDDRGRIILLHWRDPFDGSTKWEPPGGGIAAGETPLQAARRELIEETGLRGDLIEPRPVEIARTFRWNGREWF